MTIGIDASRANKSHKTGTEWYSFYLIKELAALDKKNQYRLYLDREAAPELIEIIKDNPNFSIKILSWPFYSFWTLGRLSLEMIGHRPDVLFIPAHTMPLIYPRRTINTIHDLAFIREENLYFSKPVKTKLFGSRPVINFLVKLFTLGKYRSDSVDYLHWSTSFALRRAKKIIAVSNFTKQEILKFYPRTNPEKIAVVHNGYNDQLYKPLDNFEKTKEILIKYGIEAPYFLYVGRLEKKKNTPALIEAFSFLKENNPRMKEKMVLIGDASFGYDEVKYVIAEFNLGHDVYMPGWVSEEDLAYIFNAAAAFIFPSKHEGFGIPVIQALACGVPTAVSDIPVLREIAGDAALYFDQNDKLEIYQALKRIISDQALREELKKRGQAQAKKFSWRQCAQETLREIENC